MPGTLVIELNDAGVLTWLAGSREPHGPPDPGYAWVEGGAVRTGAAAAAVARLEPKHVHTRFWTDLDTAPLGRPFPSGLRRADLAHAHLDAVWHATGARASSVILAVPGSFAAAQLSLMLGIARECGMPVDGMVDAAVAASSVDASDDDAVHLDIELHRVVATAVGGAGERARRAVEVSAHTGVLSLFDAWARAVAATFVRRTRFDPLHHAATEQALYDAMPALLRRLAGEDETEIEIASGRRTHTILVERETVVAAAAEACRGIVELVRRTAGPGSWPRVLMSHRVALLPGVRERIAEVAGDDPVALHAGAAARGAAERADAIRSSEQTLPFVACLPRGPSATAAAGDVPMVGAEEFAAERAGALPPTHLVHGGRAHAITDEPLAVGSAAPTDGRGVALSGPIAGVSRLHCSLRRDGQRVVVEDHSRYGTFLNGARIDGTAELAAGDRLRVGSPGIELDLIAVADGHGAA